MKTLIILSLVGMVMISGCSFGVGIGFGGDIYYPEKLGDPAKSRHEAVRPTTGQHRNNDGGNATDRWLRKNIGEPISK